METQAVFNLCVPIIPWHPHCFFPCWYGLPFRRLTIIARNLKHSTGRSTKRTKSRPCNDVTRTTHRLRVCCGLPRTSGGGGGGGGVGKAVPERWWRLGGRKSKGHRADCCACPRPKTPRHLGIDRVHARGVERMAFLHVAGGRRERAEPVLGGEGDDGGKDHHDGDTRCGVRDRLSGSRASGGL